MNIEIKKEQLFEISELFMSLEGESKWAGIPTAYMRMTRCNFKCNGFNNPNKEIDEKGYAKWEFKPEDYKSLQDIPTITRGCDSRYSVDPQFSHMWRKYTTDELIDAIEALLPNGKWNNNGTQVIFSITGGEPLLFQRKISQLLRHPRMAECKHFLIETNASVPLRDSFVEDINHWLSLDPQNHWTWSNSPKLSSSGETRKRAIRSDVLLAQQRVNSNQMDMYLKFVCGPVESDFDEVQDVLDEYYSAGVQPILTYIMPAAATAEQLQESCTTVANMCIKKGFAYTHRLQNVLWGNGVGT